MTNQLEKVTKVTLVPEQAARAAIPYRPAQPARTVSETRRVCRVEQTLVGARSPSVVPIRDGSNTIIGYENDPGSPGTLITKRVCTDFTVITHYPYVPEQRAQPAVDYRPATVVEEFGLGWNAGARSIADIVGNGAATFKVPHAVGVVVGFNDVDEDAGYLNIDHGIYFRRQTFQVIEGGVTKGAESIFAADDVFKIERIGGRVRYYQNEALVHTSDVPSYGAAFLDVSLYSGGDLVDSPALVESIGGYSAAAMRPMDGFASETEWNYSRGVMLAIAGAASALRSRSHGVMRPMTGMGAQGKYGESRAAMRPMAGAASGSMLTPAYALSAAQMMPLYGAAFGPEVRYGFSAAIMRPMTGMGVVGKYGESRAAMAAMQGYAIDRKYLVFPAVLGGSISHFGIVTLVTSPMVGVLGGSITAGPAEATLPSAPMVAELGGEISQHAEAALATAVMRCILDGEISSIADVLLQTLPMVALLGGRLGKWAPAVEVFAMNITGGKPGGTTRYENFRFSSAALIGGRYYGASEDGLFLLEGADDAGEPIVSVIGLGQMDFGSPQLKTVTNCYLGAAAGALRLEIDALVQGVPARYSYPSRLHGSSMREMRFDLGRGLRSNYVTPTFYNDAGQPFEADTVRFLVTESTRRI